QENPGFGTPSTRDQVSEVRDQGSEKATPIIPMLLPGLSKLLLRSLTIRYQGTGNRDQKNQSLSSDLDTLPSNSVGTRQFQLTMFGAIGNQVLLPVACHLFPVTAMSSDRRAPLRPSCSKG